PRQISGNLQSPICPGVHPPLPKAKVRFDIILNLPQPEVKKRLQVRGVMLMRVNIYLSFKLDILTLN
ncbi:hypothetical protein, partial [Desulfitibacter alkalitolerans]|uniref:hypothetical protein n=1 Tax=Desulfitibacter alkalitolerans TaxID=264641 RepID=UPI0004825BC3